MIGSRLKQRVRGLPHSLRTNPEGYPDLTTRDQPLAKRNQQATIQVQPSSESLILVDEGAVELVSTDLVDGST